MTTTDHEHYLNKVNQYDANLHAILPNSVLFYKTCLSFFPDTNAPLSVLELGSGTGYVTALIKERRPDAEIVSVDKSPEMLALAKMKDDLIGVSFIEGDITEGLPEGRFDLVITTLTLHHIADIDRRGLLYQVNERLNEGGICICGDVFRPQEDWIEPIYRERWVNHMRDAGMSPEQIRDTVTGREMAWPMLDTMHGFYRKLKEAGFAKILIPLHYDMFGVFVAWK